MSCRLFISHLGLVSSLQFQRRMKSNIYGVLKYEINIIQLPYFCVLLYAVSWLACVYTAAILNTLTTKSLNKILIHVQEA